ncbi:monovalent cation/H+ antiporter subunit E [Haloferax larsenii]|uniref:Monovalent cation/H+ antiporter subunit E n=1 Tax=Haloferax larsenii TaxID=302484 RepID=A0ABY5RCT4_HALLR|nr:monovalent cation/H+ antiporter subunit E [Haloferax larsenii]UVE49253.1 monovalent cation/H+ antiporter subunit E [Haloferax larsenii]
MSETSARILVPVGESSTFRNTAAYATREARRVASETGEEATVHFVYPVRWQLVDELERSASEEVADILDRARVWAAEDLDYDDDGEIDDDGVPVSIETAVVGEDRYLFSPSDFADVLLEYARDRDLGRIIVDPEYQPGGSAPMLQPLELELSRSDRIVEEAPVDRVVERGRFPSRSNLSKALVMFGASFSFYLLLAGVLDTFNLLTGAVSAGIVTTVFSRITFRETPKAGRLLRRTGRFILYVPYLLWEILKANIEVAYIILHPSLPIDPKIQRYRAAIWDDLSVTTLANSITLTPGTLTVDVDRDSLVIHSLTGSARDGLADGTLERAVRFIYYGRAAARIPSPRERGTVEDESVPPTPEEP